MKFLGILFVLFGCPISAQASELLETMNSISGQWKTPCQAMGNGSLNTTASFASASKQAADSARKLIYVMHGYSDEACKDLYYEYRWYSNWILPSVGGEGVHPIDFTLNKITVTALTEANTAKFVAEKMCGLSEWKLGEEKVVTGLTCQGNQLGQSGYQAYNLIKVEKQNLHIDFQASAPSLTNRPTTVAQDARLEKLEFLLGGVTFNVKLQIGGFLAEDLWAVTDWNQSRYTGNPAGWTEPTYSFLQVGQAFEFELYAEGMSLYFKGRLDNLEAPLSFTGVVYNLATGKRFATFSGK